MEIELTKLLERNSKRVHAVLNILQESAYFYRSDEQDLFYFLRRYRQEFTEFYKIFYGWTLLMDSKCARVYKSAKDWCNPAITPANRAMFNFTKRDECLAFMMLLEFFEHQLEENGITVEDKENLCFRFADLLTHVYNRFLEVNQTKEPYSEDQVRAKILKPMMPELEKFRFLKKIPPPEEISAAGDELIYEALPALYHYNSSALGRVLPNLVKD
jgi:hypothetical protein